MWLVFFIAVIWRDKGVRHATLYRTLFVWDEPFQRQH